MTSLDRVEDDVRKALQEAEQQRNPRYPIPLYPGLVKIRAASTDQKKVRVVGFRIVYFTGTRGICLVAVYPQSECENLSAEKLQQLIKKRVAAIDMSAALRAQPTLSQRPSYSRPSDQPAPAGQVGRRGAL